MKLANAGDVQVYTVSGATTGRQLPDWLERRRKRSLKNDPDYANRVSLLQDFEFSEASYCLRVSEDGDYLMSTGTYKPQLHVHRLPDLSLAFDRHTTEQNVTFQLLSSDYSKSIHLQVDRRLEFHTRGEIHYEARLPRYGRDLKFDKRSTEALVPAVGVNPDTGNGEVYRLNLELGRYMKSYEVDVGGDDMTTAGGGALQGGINTGSVNVAAIAEESHNLFAFGTSIGTVEFWDPRCRARVGILGAQQRDIVAIYKPDLPEITALDFDPSGLSIATGNDEGIIRIYDLRKPIPLLKKHQGYDHPVRTIMHLTTASHEKKILSANDHTSIKLWDAENGTPWTSVETAEHMNINCVAWCKDTGMIMTANEGPAQHAFFIPQLGPAPRWCAHLDNIVEEMAEEAPQGAYEDVKFLTMPELKALAIDHLIGTAKVQPAIGMHGYYVSVPFYEQARLIANPYIYEEEQEKRVKAKIEKERASRIRGHKKVKVNQAIVDKYMDKQARREKVDTEMGILGDKRFAKFFEDEDFAVDQNHGEFKALNPSSKPRQNEAPKVTSKNDSDDSDSDEEERISKPKEPKMRISTSSYKKSGHTRMDKSLGARVQQSTGKIVKPRRSGDVVGERTVTFAPAPKKKEKEKPDSSRKGRRDEGRRSASGNVMRNL